MNNNFDFASKRSLLILLFIFLVFFLLIGKAFDYIPKEQENINNQEFLNMNKMVTKNDANKENISGSTNEMTENETTKNDLETEPKQEDIKENEEVAKSNNDKTETQIIPSEGLVPIEEKEFNLTPIQVDKVNNSNEIFKNEIQEKLAKAKTLKQNSEYEEALVVYKDILTKDISKDLFVVCYEDMANIYINQKRYGSAIVSLQKANKVSYSSSRENLIKQLYEKSGITK